MRRTLFIAPITLCLILSYPATSHAGQQSAAEAQTSLPSASRFARTIPRNTTDRRSSPVFQNGYFVQMSREVQTAKGPNVFLFDTAKGHLHELSVWPAGASKVFLTAVAAGPDGIVVAGRTMDDPRTVGAFVATQKQPGDAWKITDSNGFLAEQISMNGDGSFWAIGPDYRARQASEQFHYDTLRHFSSTGQPLGHYLPREDLADGWKFAWKSDSEIYLRSTPTGVLVYDGVDNRVYRYEAATDKVSAWPLAGDAVSGMNVTGLAVSASGIIYGSLRTPGAVKSAARGLFVLHLDAASKKAVWVPVGRRQFAAKSPRQTGSLAYLVGCDGEQIVYKAVDAPKQHGTFAWVTP